MKRFYALNKACSIKGTVGRTCLFAFFLLMSSLLFVNKTYATHAAGSDISYKWVSGNTYQVTVTFYRDCSGVSAPNNVTLDINSLSLGSSLQQTLSRIPGTGQEITHPCNSVTTNCTNSGSTVVGIQKYVYQGNVTLPGPAADWVFSYHICCRNCSISTIVHPVPCTSSNVTPELYIEATLNSLVAPTNSSPTFSVVPIGFICQGQAFTYNQGAIDPNGDSLAYQLIAPKTSASTTVSFTGSFSASNFITSSPAASLDPVTGQINITPTNTGEVGVLAVLVSEYRHGILIGSTIRDMQFQVITCTNNNPVATGINGGSKFDTTICPGTHISFTINTNDPDNGQHVTISWNSGIPGATFNPGSGAHPTATFNWVNPIKRPQPYTFVVTVQDDGCTYNNQQSYVFTINVTDIQSAITTSNFNGFQISCNGANDATATVNQFGGTAPYTWLWSNGKTTQTITNLAPNTYTVTITDAHGCTGDTSVTIIQPSAVSANIKVVADAACSGVANGKDSVSATGGVTPYTYIWSPGGQTTQVISNVSAGIYTVTVSDANNCSVVKKDTIKQPDNPITITIDTTTQNVHCNGEASGAINITVTGGTLPYAFLWSNGATTEDVSGLTAAIYTVSVTDINGCLATKIDTIIQPDTILPLISSPVINGVNITCHGGATGSANVTVSGGTPPYTYAWSNGGTDNSVSGLSAGIVTVTVFDQNGCSNTSSDTLTQPTDSFFVSIDSAHNVTCNGAANGIIFTSVHGGFPGYTFLWNNGATTANDSNLAPSVYSITVTDTLGCQASANQSITEPAALTASVLPTDTVGFNINCHGEASGGFIAIVAGGQAPYTYLWSNGATTDTITNLLAGTPAIHYTVTITDANGCIVSALGVDTLTQPDTIVPLITAATVSGGMNLLCHNDHNATAFVNVTGGTPPYNFVWSNGQTTTGAVTDTVKGLGAGVISVSITDQNGCSAFASFTITQPDSIAATFVNTNPTCHSLNNGNIALGITGGTAPYNLTWSGGGATTDTISNLAPGTYAVTIIDANGCSLIDSTVITQPDTLLVNDSPTPVLCNGAANGSISYNISGGTAPYVINANGFISANPDSVLENLAPGNYVISVIDVNGCSASVTDSISQPSVLTDSLFAGSPACFGNVFNDSIIQVASGGSLPYSYSWSNGATTQSLFGILPGITYISTVTDANGCNVVDSATLIAPTPITDTIISTNLTCNGVNTGVLSVINVAGGTGPYSFFWTNESTTDSSTGLQAGLEYHLTITDANGCVKIDSGMLSQPDSITIVPSITQPTCSDTLGSISLAVSGGTGLTYTFTWNNSATTQILDSVAAGTYSVTVMDSLGCTKSASFTLNKAKITIDSTVTQPDCITTTFGSIQVTSSGGTAPFTYNWTGPNGYTSIDSTIDSLNSGTYFLTVSDLFGCTNTATFNIASCCHLVISGVNVANPSACDSASGSIIITQITGGSGGPYTFMWSNSITTTNLLPDSNVNLSAGTYTVTVTDGPGCSTDTSITILQNQPITVTGTQIVNADVCENFVGIVFTVTGGVPPYLISATDTFGTVFTTTTDSLSNLSAGIYCVTSITDSKGCTALTLPACDTIKDAPPAFNLSISSSFISPCDALSNDSITLNVTGAIPPYTFVWSPGGATTQNLSSVIPNVQYKVTITDSHGCSTTDSITPPPTSPLTNVQANGVYPKCPSGTTADSVMVTWLNGSGPFTIILEDQIFGTADTITGIAGSPATVAVPFDDIYNVVVKDAGGCADSTTGIFVFSNGALTAVSAIFDSVTCANGHDGSFFYDVTGGNPTYQIAIVGPTGTINTTSASGLIINADPGTYIINVVDSLGCTTSDTIVLTPRFTLTDSIVVKPILCTSNPTDTVFVVVKNGTGPFTYLWSSGATTDTVTGLTYGSYTVTLTDVGTGCDTVRSFTIDSSAALNAAPAMVSNPTCGGNCNGIANANATGGVPGYTYSWSDGTTAATDSAMCPDSTYTITVTDLSGCSVVRSITTGGALPLTVTISGTPLPCGSVATTDTLTANVTGGSGTFTYLWSNGGTDASTVVSASLNYCVTVTDLGGCTGTACDSVLLQPTPPTLTFAVTNVTTCNGDSSGAIGLTVTGSGTFTYSWSNGATTQNLANLKAGTYCVTATNGTCTADSCITITQPTPVKVALNFTYTSNCDTASTINITIDTANAGGTPPYTWTWNVTGNNNAVTIFGVPSDSTYSVTVTDSKGCTTTDSLFVPHNHSVIDSAVASSTDAQCSYSNGTVILNFQNGVAPFSINWGSGSISNSLHTDTISLGAGTYTVTVTDLNSCSVVANTVVINAPPVLTDTITATNNSLCFGDNNDTIRSVVTGGSGSGYLYAWSNGATTTELDSVGGGTYSLTITDSNGCTSVSNTVIINQGLQILPNLAFTYDSLCSVTSTVTVTANPSGGTPGIITPYTYVWSPGGATTQSLASVAAGFTYAVTVTDSIGCTTVDSIVVAPNAPLALLTTNPTDALCSYSDGTIEISYLNGTAPYTITWSDGNTTSSVNTNVQDTIIDVVPGTFYFVTVSDQNGCSLTSDFVLVNSPTPLTDTIFATNAGICFGSNTDSITSIASGGTGNYTYLWSNGATTANLGGIGGGTYTQTVTDDNGCTAVSNTIIINQNSQIFPNLAFTYDSICSQTSTVTVTSSPTGGTPGVITPYTYLWSPGGATTQSISVVAAGFTYTVTVTDSVGCTAVDSILIAPNAPLALLITNPTDALCSYSNGSVEVSFQNGAGPYTITWSDGNTTSSVNTGSQDTTLSLAPGTFYFFTVTDQNGCSLTSDFVLVNAPAAITIDTFNVVQPACANSTDGSFSFFVSGGTSLTGNYNITITGPGVNIVTTTTFDTTLTNLASGTYHVVVTDDNGCSADSTIILSALHNLTATINVLTPVYCSASPTDTVSVTANGVGPFTYLWSNGATTDTVSNLPLGTISVTITDNGSGCTDTVSSTLDNSQALAENISGVVDETCFGLCNGQATVNATGGGALPVAYTYSWDNGSTTASVNNLCQGKHFVTVTNGAGCSLVDSVTINGATAALSATLAATNDTIGNCTGQNSTITVTASGGTVLYTYSWSDGTSGTSATSINVTTGGTYCVTVTDQNSCSFSVCKDIAQNQPLSLSFNVTNVTGCAGASNGSIDLTVSGGSGNFTYSWSPGAGATQDTSNLAAGTYFVTVTDKDGCTISDQATVTAPTGNSVSIVIAQSISCSGRCDAILSVDTTTAGVAPYTYVWTANVNGQTTATVSGLCPGSFSVTVTDANGCSSTAGPFTLNDAVPINANITVVNPISCNGVCDGSLTSNPSNGTPNYTYNWGVSGTAQTISSLCSGEYIVTVTDAVACSVVDSINLTQPVTLSISITHVDASGGSNNGSVTVTPSGGTTAYNYIWSPGGATTASVNGLAAGTYCVTVTDAHGCSATGCDTIRGGCNGFSVSYTIPDTIACFGSSTAEIDLSPSGGASPYTYSWSPGGSTTQNVTGLAANTYNVTVTDHGGCTNTTSIVITQPTQLVFRDTLTTPISCSGKSDGCLTVLGSGGSGNYTYQWSSPGGTTNQLCGVGANSYTVTVTDGAGCSTTAGITVQDPETMSVFVVGQGSCGGLCNGSIVQTSVSGGQPSYHYHWGSTCSGVFDTTAPTPTNLCAGCTYVVTVTDAGGCSTASDPITITALPGVSANAGLDDTICSGITSITLNGTDTGTVNKILWTGSGGDIASDSTLSTSVSGLQQGDNVFTLTVSNTATGCSATDEVTITVADATADAGPNVSYDCGETQVDLKASGHGIWTVISGTGSLSSNSDPSAAISGIPAKDSVLLKWTVSQGGCTASDTVTAFNLCLDTTLFIPTGFSPNGDGKNDLFFIKGLSRNTPTEFRVFNRWGSQVYQNDLYDNTWNGTNKNGDQLPDGTYFIVFKYVHDGTQAKTYSGYVDLRRN